MWLAAFFKVTGKADEEKGEVLGREKTLFECSLLVRIRIGISGPRELANPG